RSGHFAHDMRDFTLGFINTQKYNQELLEESYLKPMNLPTKTEMEEMNRELYLLRKRVNELTTRVEELFEKQVKNV
ncbi:MAG TPA: hypothetical protein VIO11_03865, partial [Candidatus Methanoperedens sp.]